MINVELSGRNILGQDSFYGFILKIFKAMFENSPTICMYILSFRAYRTIIEISVFHQSVISAAAHHLSDHNKQS